VYDWSEPFRVDAVAHMSSGTGFGYKARLTQHGDVLRNGRLRYRHPLAQFGRILLAREQSFKDGLAGWIGEGAEDIGFVHDFEISMYLSVMQARILVGCFDSLGSRDLTCLRYIEIVPRERVIARQPGCLPNGFPFVSAQQCPLDRWRVPAHLFLLLRPDLLHPAFGGKHTRGIWHFARPVRHALHGRDTGQRGHTPASRPDRRPLFHPYGNADHRASARARLPLDGLVAFDRPARGHNLSPAPVRAGDDDP